MERLESSLEDTDLVKFSLKLLQSKIITEDVKDNFYCLDNNHLEADIKVRYLLQQVCERVREDDEVYDRLVRFLSRLGGSVKDVCEAMRKELDRVEAGKARGRAEGGVYLTEKVVPYLVNLLVSGSHRWEAIGIALGVPEYVRDECSCHRDNPSKLSHILTAWISGNYDGARPATVDVLREALSSELVMLPKLVQCLNEFNTRVETSTETRLPSLESLEYQSYDTEVTEGKSSLLEFQVSSSGCESYQWSKDGQPLLDGADFSGVSSNILYIDRASQCTVGKYSCCVSIGSETVCSDEINLMVIYPPEKEHLIKLYSVMESEVPKDSWPPVGNSTFINLVLIKQSRISRCDYYTVRGDMDDILESKERVEYEEVFREYREGALVLVEGRPGSGKTTLVHKVTRDWATGRKVLQGAKMVFLITLRLLNFSKKDQSLLEVLEVFYGGEVLRKSVEHDLQECGGKGACFIIDGLDEYQHKNKKESVIHQLIDKKCLPFSMVIVASRPVATNKLKESCSRRVEVIGFTKSQINEYVETYPFNGSDKVVSDMDSKLKLYLSRHPNIQHMCYLPVHAAMICFLFSQLEGNIPHTETQIYEQFTISTLLRQKTRKEEQQQLKSLKDLFGEEELQFRSICKLAFDMIMNSQQVVSQSDAEVSLSDATSSVLGLLTVEHTSRHYGLEHLYTFHHLTFQEFLAAFHITGLEEQEQIGFFIILDHYPSYWNVLIFYSGLSNFGESSILLEKDFFEQYFPETDSIFKALCVFESQQKIFCDAFLNFGSLETLSFNNHFLSRRDLLAISYIISTTNYKVTGLEFNNCILSKDEMRYSFELISCEYMLNVHTLKLNSNDFGSDGALSLSNSMTYCSSLQKLSVISNNIGSSGAAALARGLKHCIELQVLDLRSNGIDSQGAAALANALKQNEKLQVLNLGSNNIDSEGAAALAFALKVSSQLQSFCLSRNNVDIVGQRTLSEQLSFCPNLDLTYQNTSFEKNVDYSGEPIEMYWERYDFELHLRAIQLPEGVSHSNIKVVAMSGGKFIFPTNTECVSGIFHIECSHNQVMIPAQIQIQHCVHVDYIRSLTFVYSTGDSTEFKFLPGGKFYMNSGVIEVTNFSNFAIVSNDYVRMQYLATLHFSKHPKKEYEDNCYRSWDMHVSVIKNCLFFNRCLEKYYEESAEFELYKEIPIEIDDSHGEIMLDLAQSDKTEIQCGWFLSNQNLNTISKASIDSYIGGCPSQIVSKLSLMSQENVANLRFNLRLVGVRQPNNYFDILKLLPDGKMLL